eukprot:Colp12_sorted_trinity150504_noHs@25730
MANFLSTEWQYSMRREMQEILPGVFLGPYAAASRSSFENLRANGITHIACIRHVAEAAFVRANFPDYFRYLILDVADRPEENIIRHFPLVRSFINEALSMGGKCLVHGNTGISRSPSLVIAYVMESRKISYAEAFNVVQRKRFCINPNEGFACQLREYEPIYMAANSAELFESRPMISMKRTREDDENDTMEDDRNLFHTQHGFVQTEGVHEYFHPMCI